MVACLKSVKDFFEIDRSVNIANVNIAPEGSVYNYNGAYGILLNDVSRIPPGDEVLLCGDYNAHTNTVPDYNIGDIKITGSNGDLDKLLINDIEHRFNDISELYMEKRLDRASMDNKPTNSHGTQLIDLCKDAGLLILNGRVGKDRNVGKFTRDDTTGSSIIDYAIATPHLFEGIHEFQIGSSLSQIIFP